MAVTYGAQGTSGSGTTSCAPQYPTGISASTSELFAIVCGRSSVADTAIDGPAGWTSLGQLEGGTGTFGVDAGTRRVSFWRKDTVTGSETGSATFSFAAGTGAASTLSGTIFRVVKTAGFTVAAQFASGADTTNGTAYSATASSSLTFTTGGLCLVGVAQNIDSGTSSARSLTATGVTFGTLGLQVDAAVANGSDHRRILGTATVNSAATTVAPVYAYTISAAGSGPAAFVVLDETAVNTDVALVGEAITSGHGTLSVPRSNGQEATFSQGSISTAEMTLALLGEAITSAAGIATANSAGNVELLGSAVSMAQQTIAPTLSMAATGEAATSDHGSVSVISMPTQINFSTLTGGTGTLVAVGGGDVTVNITGEEFTAVTGNVDSGGQALTGAATTSAHGTAAPVVTVPLSGEGAALVAGNIAPEQFADDTLIESASGTAAPGFSVALTGEAVTCAQESVEVTGDDSQALTGEAATASAGTAPPVVSVPLTGQQFSGAQYNVGAPGGATLTGAAATFSAGEVFTVNDREFALTGASMTAQDGAMFSSPLAFVAGQELTVGQADIGPINVALTGEAITVGQGALTAPVEASTEAGGRKKPRKPRRLVVEIDGQEFEVSSEDEALELLAQAKEAAQELAQRTVTKSAAAKPREAVDEAREALKQPRIVASDDLTDQAKALEREIDEIYRAAIDAIEAEARKRRAEEDEENALIQLLL
jgi:hypothetical protein